MLLRHLVHDALLHIVTISSTRTTGRTPLTPLLLSSQVAIRRVFQHCTMLTIAHRLNTIMDSDRVIVLDQGEVAEDGDPTSLLERDTSMFASMVDKTGRWGAGQGVSCWAGQAAADGDSACGSVVPCGSAVPRLGVSNDAAACALLCACCGHVPCCVPAAAMPPCTAASPIIRPLPHTADSHLATSAHADSVLTPPPALPPPPPHTHTGPAPSTCVTWPSRPACAAA